jgi:hypothetical protein
MMMMIYGDENGDDEDYNDDDNFWGIFDFFFLFQ